MTEVRPGQVYRHFKGGRYVVLNVARNHAYPNSFVVVYQALYGDRKVWVRPLRNFMGTVERPIGTANRFVLIPKRVKDLGAP